MYVIQYILTLKNNTLNQINFFETNMKSHFKFPFIQFWLPESLRVIISHIWRLESVWSISWWGKHMYNEKHITPYDDGKLDIMKIEKLVVLEKWTKNQRTCGLYLMDKSFEWMVWNKHQCKFALCKDKALLESDYDTVAAAMHRSIGNLLCKCN